MTLQADFVSPPRIATWLVNLFSPAEQAEAILGDLLEEYSQLVSKSAVAVARRWYWRQTVKTIAHLFGTGFRDAPWSAAVAVVGGFFLHGFVSGLPNKLLSALTDKYLFYWSAHFQAYMWVLNGMPIAHLVLSVFVGCIVALVARGREMVATMTLALVFSAMIGAAAVWVALHQPLSVAWMLWSCADSLAIVVGGALVRTFRSASATLPSGA
jgi:Fe2+ transport system protein B